MKEYDADDLADEMDIELNRLVPTTLDSVASRYEKELINTDEPYYIYIDSPFCLKNCKYCMFNPQETKYNSSEYKEYYVHLFNMLDKFGNILSNKLPLEVYFGGGTPNYTRLVELNGIVDRIPNFIDIPLKSIECNPVLMTDEKMEFVIKNKFTYVSFGIQSLNNDVLKGQNRLTYNIPRLICQIKELRSHGIYVNCDLLAFMETGEISDLKVFEEDLNAIGQLGSDCVTLYPMKQRFEVCMTRTQNFVYGKDVDDTLNRIRRFRSVIVKFVRDNPDFILHSSGNDAKEFLSNDNIRKYSLYDTRILRDKMPPHIYNCSGYPIFPSDQTTIGFGGTGKKTTYGHIRDGYYYQIFGTGTSRAVYEEEIKAEACK